MKKVFLISLLVFISCVDFRPAAEKKAEQDATNFYYRICASVYNTGSSSWTLGWQQIYKNYRAGKKILFIESNQDFSIVVVRNSSGEAIPRDSTQPIDTVAATAPALNTVAETMKKLQTLTNQIQQGK
jgi:hypothetical protein